MENSGNPMGINITNNPAALKTAITKLRAIY
jgi:hypothetical protein